MSVDELRAAITGPAARVGATVETSLLVRLVADAAGQAGVLPLVSHALAETWRRRRGMTLSLAGYQEVGGLEHAVARTAERVFASLSPARQESARQVFLRLIALGEGTDDTKRRVAREEVGFDEPLLEELARARLLTLDDDRVELAHEALIRSWPRLRDWIAEDREGLRVHRRLTDAAEAWEAHDRDPGSLYQGVRLAIATEWHARTAPALIVSEADFLRASEAERQRQAASRRRVRRQRQVIALLSVLLLVATGATAYAFQTEREATVQRARP